MELCGRALDRLTRDSRATAAIEFALIFPVLVLLYVGAVEIGNLLTIDRRLTEVASAAADLTAQVKSVSTSDLSDVTSAATSIMTPYSTTPLNMVISSVVADQNNVGKVAWSYALKGAPRAKGSTYNVPAGLTSAGSSVIVAEISYAFTPLLGLSQIFSPGTFTIQRTFYERPRRSLTVACTNC